MKLKELENAWLSPTGKLVTEDWEFFGEGSWHMDLALCILRDKGELKEKMDAFHKVNKKIYLIIMHQMSLRTWVG